MNPRDCLHIGRNDDCAYCQWQVSLAQVAELVESEEKAWQTVAKLRIDLQTTDRLRLRVKELEADQATRPMSEAPRDGRAILVNHAMYGWIEVEPSNDEWGTVFGDNDVVASACHHWIQRPDPIGDAAADALSKLLRGEGK